MEPSSFVYTAVPAFVLTGAGVCFDGTDFTLFSFAHLVKIGGPRGISSACVRAARPDVISEMTAR